MACFTTVCGVFHCSLWRVSMQWGVDIWGSNTFKRERREGVTFKSLLLPTCTCRSVGCVIVFTKSLDVVSNVYLTELVYCL